MNRKRNAIGRRCALVLLLLLAGYSSTDREEPLVRVVRLQREGKYQEAQQAIEDGLITAPRNSGVYWELRLRKAQILGGSNRQAALEALLDSPPADAYAILRARFKIQEAFIALDLSRYAQALQAAQEAEALAQPTASRFNTYATAELIHAQILAKQGRFAEAEPLARDGNRRVLLLKDPDFEAYGLSTLASILTEQSRFEDALQLKERELALRLKLGDPHNVATSLISLGYYHSKLGDTEAAMDLYQRAQKLLTKEARRTLQYSLGNIGTVYLDRGDWKPAQKYLEEALSMAQTESEVARWKSNLAELFIALKDWPKAEALNSQALDLRRKDHESLSHSLIIAARILEGQGRPDEAIRIFCDIVRQESTNHEPVVLAHSGLARIYARLGKDGQADEEYQAALRVVEDSRSTLRKDENKLAFLSSQIEVHGDYIDYLMSQGKTQRALEVAEATRARILQERTGSDEATRTVSAALYKRLAQNTGANLVSYWLGPRRSYVWFTTPEKIVAYPLPPQEKLRRQVESYRLQIESESDPLDDEEKTGADLYEELLGPVADKLQRNAHLIVVPDGALNALNLETLPVQGAAPHFFIDDAIVSVAPSLNLLVQERAPENRDGRILLIGNADSTDEHYPSLPFAEREMSDISHHFAPAKVARFEKERAIPAAYERSDGSAYSYVHFTAHASANRDVPLESAIILSGAAGANRLTAEAVRDHPIAANLVIISACRSAGAKTFAGEGLVGFMWAFFRAGARSIVAGLWDVSDESTAMLMDQLYTGLTGGVPTSEALREAKLKVMHSNATFRLPYFWGPFQLYVQSADQASHAAGNKSKRAVKNIKDL
jgi:CHAT domain-containing protein/Flp pilus assembly protein TadD